MIKYDGDQYAIFKGYGPVTCGVIFGDKKENLNASDYGDALTAVKMVEDKLLEEINKK